MCENSKGRLLASGSCDLRFFTFNLTDTSSRSLLNGQGGGVAFKRVKSSSHPVDIC